MAGKNRRQQGYALLMVVFLATTLLILSMMVAPNILTYGKREKEKELIWRGKQYVRGIKLHYRKLGRFPTNLDDLTKPKVGNIRFMRQAYKDPMNKQDGSWRLIYVGPGGQLLGSLKPPQQIQFGQVPGFGTPVSALVAPGAPGSTTQPGALGATNGQVGPQPASAASPGSGTASGTDPQGISGAPVSADAGTGPNSPVIPTGDTPTIVGGNIIGVGSKINMSSVKIYEKATNYRLFEFIWDPSKDVNPGGLPGLPPAGLQNPLQNTPGAPAPGQSPAVPPANPPQNPQQQ